MDLNDLRKLRDEKFYLDEEEALEAVKKDGNLLKHVRDQTLEICLAAVAQNPEAIYFVNEEIFDSHDEELANLTKAESLVQEFNKEKYPITDLISVPFSTELTQLDLVFQYNDGFSDKFFLYINDVQHSGQGVFDAFKEVMCEVINLWRKIFYEQEGVFSKNDCSEGLVVALSVESSEEMKEGELVELIRSQLMKFFPKYLEENRDEAKKIVEKSMMVNRARATAAKVRELTQRNNAKLKLRPTNNAKFKF